MGHPKLTKKYAANSVRQKNNFRSVGLFFSWRLMKACSKAFVGPLAIGLFLSDS